VELSVAGTDGTRTVDASCAGRPTEVADTLPELPGRWVSTARGRWRARISACSRHPVAWMHSALARRRGFSGRTPVSADDVLARLGELPVSEWTYGFDHRSVRHLGPMAQDFAAAFALGHSERRISAVDANGVCMAAIQALYRRVLALEAAQLGGRPAIGADPAPAAESGFATDRPSR